MNTTIFCSFDQQDLADLAVGRLRASSLDIRSIHYVGGFKPRREEYGAAANVAAVGFSGMMNSFQGQVPTAAIGAFNDTPDVSAPMPSPPVTVKIVCSDSATAAVKAKLINMRAYQIITTR